CQMGFVGRDITREAARDRPDRAGVERVEECCMRHQPRHAAVAVEERVYPRETVMRGGSGKDRLGLAEPAVHLLKSCEKAWNGRRANGDMTANPDISLAQLPRNDLHTLVRVQVFDP